MSSTASIAIRLGTTPDPIHTLSRDWSRRSCSSDAPTVFVVDEDVSLQQSLEALIHAQGWEAERCNSVEDFLRLPRRHVPGCLILAFSSTGVNGLAAQKRISTELAEIPIVILADYEDVPTTVKAMKTGAIDFLIKPVNAALLVTAIHQGLSRSRALLDRLAEMRDLRSRYASLTPREQQVLTLVVSGLLNKQVGGELGISESTVKAYRGQVMQKMKADSLAHMVNMASRLRVARPFQMRSAVSG